MKPNLNKDQRNRLFLLARLLDRVPRKRFDMSQWIQRDGNPTTCGTEEAKRLRKNECGYAGCAMGWGMTSPKIRCYHSNASSLFDGFGFTFSSSDAGYRIFGTHRKATPKQVASDIRRYLKDGTLPAS